MAGRFARVLCGALLTATLALAGIAATVRPASAAGSAPNKPPIGVVGVLGQHFDGYCVKHFKPHSVIKVTNTRTGVVVYIHTNSKGAGCVQVPIERACQAVTQTFVATGVDAAGKPATVTDTVTVPATPSLCSSPSGGVLPFTGTNVIIPGAVIGIALIGVGGVLNIRRRKHDPTT